MSQDPARQVRHREREEQTIKVRLSSASRACHGRRAFTPDWFLTGDHRAHITW